VQTLLIFPREVIDRAVDPVQGIPAKVTTLNLARIRAVLDTFAEEYWEQQQRIERANRKRLPEPLENPEVKERIARGLRELVTQLKRGTGPSTAG